MIEEVRKCGECRYRFWRPTGNICKNPPGKCTKLVTDVQK